MGGGGGGDWLSTFDLHGIRERGFGPELTG